MGILSSRQAQASAPSSPAAINKGKYASLDEDEVNYLPSNPLNTVARSMQSAPTQPLASLRGIIGWVRSGSSKCSSVIGQLVTRFPVSQEDLLCAI